MFRRDLLRLLGAILLGSSSRGYAQRDSGRMEKSKKRIVVIGAGLAGLAAARELKSQGHDVLVVEARDRIGGRIWTSTQWPDMPLDLGATWIHGIKGNPLTDLAQQIQARRLLTHYEKAITYNTQGEPLSNDEEVRMALLKQQIYAEIEWAQEQDFDLSIRQVVEPLLAELDTSTEAYRFINFILSGELEQEYSGSASRLSAHWYDSAKEFDGDDALFIQGFTVITDFLARELDIELGHVVQEIQWESSPLRVISQKSEFVADHVVVTLPLGVLKAKQVRFLPDLPSEKQNAITKLGMGVLNKCYLRFEQAFWPHDVDWLEYVSAKPGEWSEWVSFKRAADMPVLLGFNAAERAIEIEKWSDQEVVASAMQCLETIFGAGIPKPIDYQISRWATDPFAFGSYSYNAVGAIPGMRNDLASPLGNTLFFAGEASHIDFFGTAHGAYLSGRRAAKELLFFE